MLYPVLGAFFTWGLGYKFTLFYIIYIQVLKENVPIIPINVSHVDLHPNIFWNPVMFSATLLPFEKFKRLNYCRRQLWLTFNGGKLFVYFSCLRGIIPQGFSDLDLRSLNKINRNWLLFRTLELPTQAATFIYLIPSTVLPHTSGNIQARGSHTVVRVPLGEHKKSLRGTQEKLCNDRLHLHYNDNWYLMG